jgi:hypothetical protein
VSAEASDTVTIPRAELEALKAELCSYTARWDAEQPELASRQTLAPAMPLPPSPAAISPRRGESVSDRLVRFPGATWQEIEALPQPVQQASAAPNLTAPRSRLSR